MMAKAISIEASVSRGPELSKLVLPLLLVVHGAPQDNMSNLISGPDGLSSVVFALSP